LLPVKTFPETESIPPETFDLKVGGKIIKIKKGDCFKVKDKNWFLFKGQIDKIVDNKNFKFKYEEEHLEVKFQENPYSFGSYGYYDGGAKEFNWNTFVLEDCDKMNDNIKSSSDKQGQVPKNIDEKVATQPPVGQAPTVSENSSPL
jgi:hypothetical protein